MKTHSNIISELIQGLQNAASRGACELEVNPLLTDKSASTVSLANRIVTMMLIKYSVLCFLVLYHVDHSALVDDIIMDTKTSSSSQHNVSAKPVSLVRVNMYGLTFGWHFRQIRDIRIDFSGIVPLVLDTVWRSNTTRFLIAWKLWYGIKMGLHVLCQSQMTEYFLILQWWITRQHSDNGPCYWPGDKPLS